MIPIERALKRRAVVGRLTAAAEVAGGVGIMLDVCAGFAGLVTSIIARRQSYRLLPIASERGVEWWSTAWWVSFLGSAAVFVPLSIWSARRNPVEEPPVDVSDLPCSSRRGLSHVVLASHIRSIFESGGRLVLGGLERKRRIRTISDNGRKRAAGMIESLLVRDLGLPARRLLAPGEPPDALLEVLNWLEACDWVGRTRDGTVYLLTEGRRRLDPEVET